MEAQESKIDEIVVAIQHALRQTGGSIPSQYQSIESMWLAAEGSLQGEGRAFFCGNPSLDRVAYAVFIMRNNNDTLYLRACVGQEEIYKVRCSAYAELVTGELERHIVKNG